MIGAIKRGEWEQTDRAVVAGGVVLEPGEYELVLRPRNQSEGRTLPGDVGVVVLDTAVDDELEAEGTARDVVRLVQQERRNAGLHVSDCIVLDLAAPAAVASAVERHRSYVAEQTLAVDLRVREADELSIAVTKAPCQGPDAEHAARRRVVAEGQRGTPARASGVPVMGDTGGGGADADGLADSLVAASGVEPSSRVSVSWAWLATPGVGAASKGVDTGAGADGEPEPGRAGVRTRARDAPWDAAPGSTTPAGLSLRPT